MCTEGSINLVFDWLISQISIMLRIKLYDLLAETMQGSQACED